MNTLQANQYQNLINEISELDAKLQSGEIDYNTHGLHMTQLSDEMRVLARKIKHESFNEYGFALRANSFNRYC